MQSQSPKRARGPQRTQRRDWLRCAREILIEEGSEKIKILTLAKRLDCARSSFYWYFDSREDLLSQLLDDWQHTNTQPIIEHAQVDADSITEAALKLFECWADERLFNSRLDFAVREWSRRDKQVRQLIDQSDQARIEALRQMFLRHGYAQREATIRARTLYHAQIGYYALGNGESLAERTAWVAEYVYCYTGQQASKAELAAFKAYIATLL